VDNISVFAKTVDLLTTINDIKKNGYKGKVITDPLIDSLVTSAVHHYNLEFGPKPKQPEQTKQPEQQEIVPGRPVPQPPKYPQQNVTKIPGHHPDPYIHENNDPVPADRQEGADSQ